MVFSTTQITVVVVAGNKFFAIFINPSLDNDIVCHKRRYAAFQNGRVTPNHVLG